MNDFRSANRDVAVPLIGYTGGYAIAATDDTPIRTRRNLLMNRRLIVASGHRRARGLLFAETALAR